MKILIFALILGCGLANATEKLTIDEYLGQVRSRHAGYKSALQNRQGALGRAAQANLITSPRLEGNYQRQRDQALSQDPSFTYDRLDSESYSLGIVQTTTFGLDAKVSYDVGRTSYINPDISMPDGNQISSAKPTLSLTLSLWRNASGRLTKNQIAVATAQAEAERYTSEALMNALIQEAVNAYWNLAIQKEIVEIQKAALKQSQELYNYNLKRSQMNLVDRADTLQARARLESKRLDLQAAIDRERALLRAFNLLRDTFPAEDPGELASFSVDGILKVKLPGKHGNRADIKAAKAQAEASAANYTISAENNRPILNLFGSYSLNGRAANNGSAISDSYYANRPTTAIGLTLSIPLDFSSLEKAQSGALVQAQAAQTAYQQMLSDQEGNWTDLEESILAAQRRVELSEMIVKAESEKIEYERARLREGRTSTYQILLFEQDYIDARLALVRNIGEVVSLINQIRLYDLKEEGGML